MTKTVRVMLTHTDLDKLLEGKQVEHISNVGYGNMDVHITLEPVDIALKKTKNGFAMATNKGK